MIDFVQDVATRLDSVFGSRDSPEAPQEDVHEDEDAEVGDLRVQVVPAGELWGYDKEISTDKFLVRRQWYGERATYASGAKHYMWYGKGTLFEGTIEEWNSIKDTPEKQFQDIPANWETIVEHVDSFLELHGDHLNTKEYPNSVKELEQASRKR